MSGRQRVGGGITNFIAFAAWEERFSVRPYVRIILGKAVTYANVLQFIRVVFFAASENRMKLTKAASFSKLRVDFRSHATEASFLYLEHVTLT